MIKNIILFAFLSVLLSCTDHEDLYNRDYPLLKTLPSENISSYGATFSATQVGDNQFPAEDYGFIWNKTGYQSKIGSESKSLGSTDQLSDFSLEISKSLDENETYYVMAYAIYNKQTIIGNVERFTSTPAPTPQLKKLVPATGTWGDTIKVIGKDFSYIKEKNTVLFGTIASKILEINDTTLKVIVPSTLKEVTSPVIAIVSVHKSEPLDFILKKPILTSSSKMEIALCDTIEIRGENLPPNVTDLNFSGTSTKLIKATPTTYKVAVPFLSSSITSVTVSMNYSDETFTLSTPLTFKGTKLESFTPALASFLDTVKIFAQNLPACGGLSAQAGTLKLNIIENGSNYIRVVIPATDLPGSIIPIQILRNSDAILVANVPRELSITSITPSEVEIYDVITIKGKGFHPDVAKNRITINSSSTPITLISSTVNEIKFKAPAITSPFNTPINLNLSSGNSSKTVSGQFKVFSPVITSISPANILTGNLITVSGQHFSPVLADNRLQNIYTTKFFKAISASTTELVFEATHDALAVTKFNPIKYQSSFALYVGTGPGLTTSQKFNIDYRGYWTEKASFPGMPRTGAVTITSPNRLYFGLGKAGAQVLNDFWMYDLLSNTWTQLADFPSEARYNGMAWQTSTAGFVSSGTNASSVNLLDVWKFNLANRSWTQLGDFPGSTLSKAYTLVGQCYVSTQNEFWKFNASNDSWTRLNDLPFPIVLAGADLSSIYALVSGSTPSNLIYRYNTTTDLWTSTGFSSSQNNYWANGATKLYQLNPSIYQFQQFSNPGIWASGFYGGPQSTGQIYFIGGVGTKIYVLQGTQLSEFEAQPSPFYGN